MKNILKVKDTIQDKGKNKVDEFVVDMLVTKNPKGESPKHVEEIYSKSTNLVVGHVMVIGGHDHDTNEDCDVGNPFAFLPPCIMLILFRL